ncbi:esterase [Massilia forsythiae]|uniref:Esterase n=1 Tax=Massilia forsythiae TaxID=2728020 RepID=A0A7Z2ZRL9_9BURK|nr:esterase [Massilia forsythiae]QJD99620.1 esterase [Massilia forsythiae]
MRHAAPGDPGPGNPAAGDPAADDTPAQVSPLVILLHGVGGTPADMAPLAALVETALPRARIAAPPAALPYDLGPHGFQWFSVDDIDEAVRPGRIAAALDAFVATVEALQRAHGAGPADTVLVGFSQGAIMALAACAQHWLAHHVVAIAGRFAPLPVCWERRTVVSLVHGRMDGVMPVAHSELAAARLAELGADVRLQLVPRGIHMLTPALLAPAVHAVLEESTFDIGRRR